MQFNPDTERPDVNSVERNTRKLPAGCYANRNSYALYRMALFLVTFSNHNLPQTTPFSTSCFTFYIFVMSGVRDFKFGR